MNRNTRKYGRVPKPGLDTSRDRVKVFASNGGELEEVYPPKNRGLLADKAMTSRACEIIPDCKDFSTLTNCALVEEQYQNLLMDQYGFDPVVPETLTQLKRLRKVLFGLSPNKVENSSQCVNLERKVTIENILGSPDESYWHDEDADKFVVAEGTNVVSDIVSEVPQSVPNVPENVKKSVENRSVENRSIENRNVENRSVENRSVEIEETESPKNISIKEEPRVKTIAEKFCKYKKNNVELRKLVEKIACIEYDVYDKDMPDSRPVQMMRAYFSMKPACSGQHEENAVPLIRASSIPSIIKRRFQISEEDFKKLSEKEIEILDGKIAENQPYLDDLKKVLRRKQAINTRKKRDTLDLQSLYEMAKKENVALDYDFSNTNLLSKAELMEVKDLILQRCSSAQGIDRRTIHSDKFEYTNDNKNAISQITFMEVMK